MTAQIQPTRVIFIGDSGPVLDQVSATLGSQQEFDLNEVLTNAERLSRDIHAAEPDIILIDSLLNGEPTSEILDDIANQFPQVAIIAILSGSDPVLAQQAMLGGARGFIYQPFTQINLMSTLRRVRDLEGRTRKAASAKDTGVVETKRPLKTIMVFSPRGGVGCSTLAANLAVLLQKESGKRVLLMEGKLFFGHLDILMNIRPQNTLADLIPHANNMDANLLQDVVMVHNSGLHVLLAPSSMQVSQGIRADDLYNVFINIQRLYDLIVVDGGSTISENTVTLMDAADRILVVANPELASLHDVTQFVQITRSLGYPQDKVLIVLNKYDMKGGVKLRDINTAMRQKVFAHIPSDDENCARSLNRGIPLVLRYPRSPVSRAMKQLTKTFIAMSAAEGGEPQMAGPGEKKRRDALMASSRLG